MYFIDFNHQRCEAFVSYPISNANGNPTTVGFLCSLEHSKMCFEHPQNRFKTLETILPTPLKVGGESYSEVVRF